MGENREKTEKQGKMEKNGKQENGEDKKKMVKT